MKKSILLLFVLSMLMIGSCTAQPSGTTTYEVGIIQPTTNTTYLFFVDIQPSTTTSRLTENMDYLSPDVSDLMTTLHNYKTIGDTLFGEFTLNLTTDKRFLKAGLVQKNNSTNRYSGMTVSNWLALDQLEPQPAFFIRKKQ